MNNGHENSNHAGEIRGGASFSPIDAVARVSNENGRWVVILDVTSWEPSDDSYPVTNHWKRINDYATEDEARVAASWIEKSANKNICRSTRS